MAKKKYIPKPVVKGEICSICGESWSLHPENPSIFDCIEILKNRRFFYFYPFVSTSSVPYADQDSYGWTYTNNNAETVALGREGTN